MLYQESKDLGLLEKKSQMWEEKIRNMALWPEIVMFANDGTFDGTYFERHTEFEIICVQYLPWSIWKARELILQQGSSGVSPHVYQYLSFLWPFWKDPLKQT